MSDNAPTRMDDTLRFPSAEALRAAHGELLKRFRAGGGAPELVTEAEAFIRRGRATGTLLDADTERWEAQSQLDYWATQLYRPDYEPPDATLEEFDPQLAPELDDSLCPYLGLDAFQEVHQAIFFGRERLLEELLGKLETARFLAVVGFSGSGKSSLVRASLLPTLKTGGLPGSAEWLYFPPMVPGSNPLANLARLIAPPGANTGQNRLDVDLLLREPGSLPHIVSERFGHKNIVLIVDQFEEIFTLCTDQVARLCFIDHLIELCQAPEFEHHLIVTMRSDFEPNIARLPDLQTMFYENVVRVTPLTAAELREAIEAPASRVGLKFEEGLVNALLNDIVGEPAALPLLQFTLRALWDRRERNRVLWEAYKKLGGGRQALARSADAFYDKLIPEEQLTMRRILLKLVRPGEGLEVTSNRVPRATLYQKAEAGDRVERVLEKLIATRLVRVSEGDVAADGQVEVAHEALVRNWPRLVEWLEEERVALRQRQRLTSAAAEWQRLGREPAALWRGLLLAETHRYDDLDKLESEFVAAGYEAEHAEAQHKLEQQRLEERARSASQLGMLTIGLFVMLLIAITAGVAASFFAREAQTQANLALARQLAVEAQSIYTLGDSRQGKAVLLAVESMQLFPSVEAAQILQNKSLPIALIGHNSYVSTVAFSPDGKHVVSGSSDHTVRVWRVATGLEIARMTHDNSVTIVAFSPDGKYVASGSSDHTARVWETLTGKEVARMTYNGGVSAVTFSQDGKYVVSGSTVSDNIISNSDGNTLAVWDMSTGKEVAHINYNSSINAVAFSPDGKHVVSGSSDNTARVWDTATGKEVARMNHNGDVNAVTFSPDGKHVVSGSSDNTARVWDAATGKEVARMIHDSVVNAVAFSPDGKHVVSGSSDNTARVWDAATGKEVARMIHDSVVNAVAFGPDGKHIVSGSSDNTAGVWDASTGREVVRITHDDYVTSVAFSSDGKYVVSGSFDKTIQVSIWQPDDLIAYACAQVPRNLTRAEWQQYIGDALPYQSVCRNLPIEPETTPTP